MAHLNWQWQPTLSLWRGFVLTDERRLSTDSLLALTSTSAQGSHLWFSGSYLNWHLAAQLTGIY
jgi:hypothetical protein